MIKMIAVDMDGTFLDENGRYDIERFEKILEELQKRENASNTTEFTLKSINERATSAQNL